MKRLMILALLCVVFALLCAKTNTGIIPYVDDWLSRDRGPPTTDWYAVEQWEINYCMAHGGTDYPLEGNLGSLDNTTTDINTERMVALQAEVNTAAPGLGGEGSEALEESSTSLVYEAAWFVQPMGSEDLNYEVFLVTESGSKESISSGSCNYYNPAKGFYAVEKKNTDIKYQKALLEYSNEDTNENLEVTVVE